MANILKMFGFKNVWNAYQKKAYKELSSLDDKILKDIGMHRGDILDYINNMKKD